MADTNEYNSRSPQSRNGEHGNKSNRDKRHRQSRRQHCDFDEVVNDKLREIESSGEPLSIAESISHEFGNRLKSQDLNPSATPTATGKQNDVTDLQRMSEEELAIRAPAEGVQVVEGQSRQELILAILKNWVKSRGIMFGQGTLQILPDGFGFLRSPAYQYMSCPDDIYVSPSQIRKFNLRNGSVVRGQVRPPKESERYFALLRVESINGIEPSDSAKRSNFDDLTPLHPDQRIVLEHDPKDLSTRVVDMLAPIGFGQRGLIVSPPRAGKTVLMQKMALATLKNYPEAYVIILLIDERPEEVTDMQREVQGERCEVISSTFDEPTLRHVQVAEMVLEKAKRMVESGTDVVVFLDSITRLGRAWNSECPQSGKTLSGGLDVNAMQKPKAFFGSARKLEEGGSLTILATALVDTGSKMDEVIFEEFKGTGNLEIVLDRSMVDKRIWPAIDINASGTRREERLFEEDEYDRICRVRRVLSEMNPPDAMDMLTTRLRKANTNAEFLMGIKFEDGRF